MIKHLVISGGANVGFIYFGVLETLIEKNYIVLKNIDTFYCTSVGTLITVMLTLDYDMKDIQDFLLERPWQELYHVDFTTVARAIKHGGLFDKSIIVDTLKPLLLGKDLKVDITLQEYYEYCKKEIHFFVTKFSTFELVDVSHKTHPHWKLIDTVFASSCMPVLFDPIQIDDEYYIDGGILKNYPLHPCIENRERSEVFGLYIDSHKELISARTAGPFPSENSGYRLFEYLYSFIYKMWTLIKHERTSEEIGFDQHIGIVCDTHPNSILQAFQSKTERKQLYESGIEIANEYLEKLDI